MKTKTSKIVLYPIAILTLIFLIMFSVYGLLNSIGTRMNPPQPNVAFEPDIVSASIWKNVDGIWQINQSDRLAVFKTDNESLKAEGQELGQLPGGHFGDVAFFIVRDSLDKEKSKELLKVLSKFGLRKVYIASPFDDTLAALKKLEPRFWYASSPRSWVKWSLFSTFGIEKAFTIDADFLFVDDEILKLMSEKIKAEIKRRNLPVVSVNTDGKAVFN